MSIVTLLVTLAATLTHHPCAAIENHTNTAAWSRNGNYTTLSDYTDYGDNLGYEKHIPLRIQPTVLAAEQAIDASKPGRKIVVVCTY